MLHRMALRVIPSLAMAVTAEPVRKRKRWVMGVPGLAAFLLYRLIKQTASLQDPAALLTIGGLFATATSLLAYQIGRRQSWPALWREDGARLLFWVGGWVGFIYGVQLALLVLALLKLVRYDFWVHPDGPAMMAIIIAVTSVARDAFEIGHVRWLQRQGEPVVTFPDGRALWTLLKERPLKLGGWAVGSAALCASATFVLFGVTGPQGSEWAPLVLVGAVAATLMLLGYLASAQGDGGWTRIPATFGSLGWAELFRFWWWPGVAFAATYYLVALGVVAYGMRMQAAASVWYPVAMAAVVGTFTGAYGVYLGDRRHLEDRLRLIVPPSVLRCPFVVGILSRSSGIPDGETARPVPVEIGAASHKAGAK
jgi:MFS family permease